ncbi:MAG: hypothetical protein K8R68_06405 [Bacteroidales bacterium]|nr:hypothetical protein [Bacteroidales bacterium]
MKKIVSLILLTTFFFALTNCSDPEEKEENPYLKVVNGFDNYQLTLIMVNSQLFIEEGEFLLPNQSTNRLQVNAGKNLVLAYTWHNVNDTADHDSYSRITNVGDYPELEINSNYTLTFSGDKESPTIVITNN